MSEHYYTAEPRTKHDIRRWQTVLRGKTYTFYSDAGVFSKDRIDAGSKLLIEAMEIPQNAQVLDLGCGYGPIGIVAAHLAPQGHVVLIDVNRRAAESAERNLQENGIRNAEVRVGEGFSAILGMRFDVILTNPPIRAGKRVIYPLMEQARDHLNPGGRLYVVIRTSQGADSMRKHLKGLFGEARDVEKESGYRVIVSEKS